MSVRFRLYGCERMKRQRMIGECIVSFANINFQLQSNIWVPLEPKANTAVSTFLLYYIYTNVTKKWGRNSGVQMHQQNKFRRLSEVSGSQVLVVGSIEHFFDIDSIDFLTLNLHRYSIFNNTPYINPQSSNVKFTPPGKSAMQRFKIK